VRVQCEEEAPDRTHVTVVYALTALTPAGNTTLSELTPAGFSRMLQSWHDAIIRSQIVPPR
jgi:hypothetical protein